MNKALTKTQQRVLFHMKKGEWHSAYSLQTSIATLNALCNKGYLERKRGVGSIFSPRNEIQFRVIECPQPSKP